MNTSQAFKNPVKVELSAGSYYEMTEKTAQHYVAPQTDFVYSIMVIGTPWSESVSPDRELFPLEKTKAKELLKFFTDRIY